MTVTVPEPEKYAYASHLLTVYGQVYPSCVSHSTCGQNNTGNDHSKHKVKHSYSSSGCCACTLFQPSEVRMVRHMNYLMNSSANPCSHSTCNLTACTSSELPPTITVNQPGSTVHFISKSSSSNSDRPIMNVTVFLSPGSSQTR